MMAGAHQAAGAAALVCTDTRDECLGEEEANACLVVGGAGREDESVVLKLFLEQCRSADLLHSNNIQTQRQTPMNKRGKLAHKAAANVECTQSKGRGRW